MTPEGGCEEVANVDGQSACCAHGVLEETGEAMRRGTCCAPQLLALDLLLCKFFSN